MDESLSDWLALREAADWTSRSESLVALVKAAIPSSRVIHALDLCTGTGSNLRYLMDRLPACQRWLALDRDAALLAELTTRLSRLSRARGWTFDVDETGSHIRGGEFVCDVEARQMNLNQLDAGIFAGRDLVTASALLDLVSEEWLRTLAERCRQAGAAALFSITYDGRSTCDPSEPEDELIRELMNRHQKTDKGLGGIAAGPDAAAVAARVFHEAGFRVECATSDWSIDHTDRAFQRMLIEGWAHAAREIAPHRRRAIDDWLKRRLNHVSAGRSRIVVGHSDMAAWVGR